MSYEFLKTYNVAVASGCSTITDYTEEATLQRANAVKNWFDENFEDIFRTIVVADSSELITNYCYFKGTNSGIYMTQRTQNNYLTQNVIGFFRGTDKTVVKTNLELAKGQINFYFVKSKYGVIAGFYKDDISMQVKTMIIYHNNKLYPVILNSSTTTYICYDTQSEPFALTKRGGTSKAVLTTFAPPQLDFTPEGIYWSIGASPSTIGIYNIGSSSKKFIELACIPYYNSIALELVEPSVTDYTDIEDLPSTIASETVQ